MQYQDKETDLVLDNEFECASAREFQRLGKSHYAIDLLKEDFDPRYPVVWEYAFCFRVRSFSDRMQRATFRINQGRGPLKWLGGPHHIKRKGKWRVLPSNAVFEGDDYVEVAVEVAPRDEFLLANNPYAAPAEVEAEVQATVDAVDFLQAVELGHSPEGRPILAVETEKRD